MVSAVEGSTSPLFCSRLDGFIFAATEKSNEENQEGVIEVLVEVVFWRP